MRRRDVLLSMGAAVGCGVTGGFGLAGAHAVANAPVRHDLKIQAASFLLRRKSTEGLISLSPDGPPPVLYAEQGKPITFAVRNMLDEYTTMHWHGIRLPNDMDGVPYLTQFPIADGETFDYRFSPPDAGTYWYHPHCLTMTQIARGLTGVLIVKEPEDAGFDSERVINLRDFRLDDEDQLMQPYSLRGAARAGTLGNVMTANWLAEPVYDHRSGGLVRLRLANTDTTRIYRVYLSGGTGSVVAWDGHPVESPLPWPDREHPLVLGPGQRADLAVLMPESEGQRIEIVASRPIGDRVMAAMRAVGATMGRSLAELKPLPPNPLSRPDLKEAQVHEFVFGWSPDGLVPNDGFCGTIGKTFWSINRLPWPGDDAKGTGPLATLERGRSYILRFRNESPNLHPIHLHGLTFMPLRSNKRKLARNWTDTSLILKNEVIDVALVADNPGDWAFHCHVIEHQKTGLAGFIRVA
ncbi:MAG: multicopper oxidase family protein [Pseudomonadota bacterium]